MQHNFRYEQFKVFSKIGDFKDSIKQNDVTITVTPTGSGKTQGFPAMAIEALHEMTGNLGKAYVVVPRVIMAIKAMEFNSTLWDAPNMASFLTGRGGDSKNSNQALVRYITEGSFTGRQIVDKLSPKTDIVLMDEVHEQNTLTEAIMYLMVQKSLESGQKFLVMSATTNPEKYKQYFESFGLSVGVIEIPEFDRQYSHEFIESENPLRDVADMAKNGGRCLVGCSGKAEIEKTIKEISAYTQESSVKFVPYHGQLEDEVDREARDLMQSEQGGVVFVATNIVQSSVTIKDLDCGYFGGMGKRIQSVKGERKLVDYTLSKAEMKQWFGRGGRTKDFTIFWTSSEAEAFNEREDYPTASILLEPTEETIIELLGTGVNLNNESVRLINMPERNEINRAWDRLIKLNIIEGGQLSDFGKKVRNLPYDMVPSIVAKVLSDNGLPCYGRKFAEIMSDHPFRKANIRRYRKTYMPYEHSTYAVWVAVVDAIRDEFGYILDSMNSLEFKEKMDNIGVFRRTMKKLFKKYNHIENSHSDDDMSLEKKLQVIDLALRSAFADRIYNAYNKATIENMPYLLVDVGNASQAIRKDGFCKHKVGDVFVYRNRKFLTENWLMDDNPLLDKYKPLGSKELKELFGVADDVDRAYNTSTFHKDRDVEPFNITKIPTVGKLGNGRVYYKGAGEEYCEGEYQRYKTEDGNTFDMVMAIIEKDNGDKTLRFLREFASEIGEEESKQYILFDYINKGNYICVYG